MVAIRASRSHMSAAWARYASSSARWDLRLGSRALMNRTKVDTVNSLEIDSCEYKGKPYVLRGASSLTTGVTVNLAWEGRFQQGPK